MKMAVQDSRHKVLCVVGNQGKEKFVVIEYVEGQDETSGNGLAEMSLDGTRATSSSFSHAALQTYAAIARVAIYKFTISVTI